MIHDKKKHSNNQLKLARCPRSLPPLPTQGNLSLSLLSQQKAAVPAQFAGDFYSPSSPITVLAS
jgi:hypothetical protein